MCEFWFSLVVGWFFGDHIVRTRAGSLELMEDTYKDDLILFQNDAHLIVSLTLTLNGHR